MALKAYKSTKLTQITLECIGDYDKKLKHSQITYRNYKNEKIIKLHKKAKFTTIVVIISITETSSSLNRKANKVRKVERSWMYVQINLPSISK